MTTFKDRKEESSKAEEALEKYGQTLNFEKVWLMFQETDRMLSEKFNETDKQMKETAKEIKKLSALFTSQWGKLVESLVEGDLIKLLKEKGIPVEQTLQRVKGNHEGENYEYDIIAVNGDEIVIVEVKTTLRPQDVKDFHEKIWKAKKYMSAYKDKVIYGCVAFISADGASDRMVEKQGFYVIKATGGSASIVNQKDFKPKKW
ncbi:MAG: hypothetical protein JEY97_04580 [Bacteroidales bacterium]|nr:hypothetical protein [Bacteroidales bacterium]